MLPNLPNTCRQASDFPIKRGLVRSSKLAFSAPLMRLLENTYAPA